MTDVQKEILFRCFQLQHENSTKDPSRMPWWIYDVWQEEMKFGPRYKCSTWFGPQSQARTKNYQRNLRKLEERGYVVRWARYGELMTNVRLTERGEMLARSLTSEVSSLDREPQAVSS